MTLIDLSGEIPDDPFTWLLDAWADRCWAPRDAAAETVDGWEVEAVDVAGRPGWVLRRAATPGEVVHGSGEAFLGPDLNGQSRLLINRETNGAAGVDLAYLNVPFIWSDSGWSLSIDTGAPVLMDLSDVYTVLVLDPDAPEHLAAPGGETVLVVSGDAGDGFRLFVGQRDVVGFGVGAAGVEDLPDLAPLDGPVVLVPARGVVARLLARAVALRARVRGEEVAPARRLQRIVLPDFDYTAKVAEKLEVSPAERAAKWREQKARERANAKAKVERRATAAAEEQARLEAKAKRESERQASQQRRGADQRSRHGDKPRPHDDERRRQQGAATAPGGQGSSHPRGPRPPARDARDESPYAREERRDDRRGGPRSGDPRGGDQRSEPRGGGAQRGGEPRGGARGDQRGAGRPDRSGDARGGQRHDRRGERPNRGGGNAR